jgi:hypothetical protein
MLLESVIMNEKQLVVTSAFIAASVEEFGEVTPEQKTHQAFAMYLNQWQKARLRR